MSTINQATREIQTKIVHDGPGLYGAVAPSPGKPTFAPAATQGVADALLALHVLVGARLRADSI